MSVKIKCPLCKGKQFNNWRSYAEHIIAKHPTDIERNIWANDALESIDNEEEDEPKPVTVIRKTIVKTRRQGIMGILSIILAFILCAVGIVHLPHASGIYIGMWIICSSIIFGIGAAILHRIKDEWRYLQ